MWLSQSWPWLPVRVLVCWRRGHDWRAHEYWVRCERCMAFRPHPPGHWADEEEEE